MCVACSSELLLRLHLGSNDDDDDDYDERTRASRRDCTRCCCLWVVVVVDGGGDDSNARHCSLVMMSTPALAYLACRRTIVSTSLKFVSLLISFKTIYSGTDIKL